MKQKKNKQTKKRIENKRKEGSPNMVLVARNISFSVLDAKLSFCIDYFIRYALCVV